MLDENAFGFLFSWLSVEDDEYSLEAEEFIARHQAFRNTVLGTFDVDPLGPGAHALDLGHAIYIEIEDDEQTIDPFKWTKIVRTRLVDRELISCAILTHGSRWVPDGLKSDSPGAQPQTQLTEAGVPVLSTTGPSEPLRRALLCEAAVIGSEQRGDGWGPGLYVDTEAVDAMGKTLKNAPTALEHGGATFYRFGR